MSEPDPFVAVHAIREAIPTRRHAEMLFDMVADLMGDAAWIETGNDGTARTLYRREAPGSDWIVPWPLIRVVRGGREGPSPLPTGISGVVEEPKRRPGRAPRLRDLGPGQLDVHDGPGLATINYGADGRWFECTRGHGDGALPAVADALAAKTASPVETVADFVAGLALQRHGGGRVRMPVPLRAGAAGVWRNGLLAFREVLFHDREPAGPGFLAADGWSGTALARGPTRESAMRAWRERIEELRPFPEPPQTPRTPPPKLPEDEPPESFENADGLVFRLAFRYQSDIPWVEPTVENSPAAVLRVRARPERDPPIGKWTWLVDAYGTLRSAAIRWEPEGFTLIGDRLLDRVDLDRIEEALAAADRDAPPRSPWNPPPGFESPRPDTRVRTYRYAGATADPTGAMTSPTTMWTHGFVARDLDAARIREAVVRMRVELESPG